MSIKKNIPNAITCCNLLCGCLAIVQAMNGNLVWAAYLVGMAAIFDFFDGFAARLLKVSSPIGKDLDSLADMVTFGVVPGIVMFKMIMIRELTVHDSYFTIEDTSFLKHCQYISFLIPIFSAVRLAKFNNDTRQSDSFIGVPTPANAIFICSLPVILNLDSTQRYLPEFPGSTFSSLFFRDPESFMHAFLVFHYFLIGACVVLSLLLVAELPLFALKFKHFNWKGNEVRFTFLILCIAMLAALRLAGIPLCIVLYVLMSVINNLITKRRGTIAG